MARHPEASFGQSFGDPAFEPQATYDFEDSMDDATRNMHNNIASLSSSMGANSSFDPSFSTMAGGRNSFDGATLFPVGTATFAPMQGMSSHIDPSSVWSDANHLPTGPSGSSHSHPRSHQNDIVKSRSETVDQRWGQITPPDGTHPAAGTKRKDSGQSTSGHTASKPKLDNAERARNAANSRHSRAKKDRQASIQESQSGPSESSDDEGDVDDKREKYREKNRLAAAKCRQKKKENVETLEDRHRNLSARNNFMKREERELRDELSRLRTLALNHVASNAMCHCDALHGYNQRQVRALAFGFGQPLPLSSPSQTSEASVAGSNPSYDAMGRSQSMSGSTPPNLTLSMPTTMGSFAGSSNYAFATVTTPQSMELSSATAGPEAHEFASFLQSSPNNRAGFS